MSRINWAVCRACWREMVPGGGCGLTVATLDGEQWDRIRYGDEPGLRDYLASQGLELRDTCHDCGVGIGQPHHAGCDGDHCPRCHGQQFICGCEAGDDLKLDIPEELDEQLGAE